MKFIFEMVPHRTAIYSDYKLIDQITANGHKIFNEEHSRYGYPCFEYWVDLPEEEIESFKQKYKEEIDARS